MRPIEPGDIDTSVAPCEDFFRYANGKWLDRTEIPASEPAWGGFNEVHERNREVLRTLADELVGGAGPAPSGLTP